MQAFATPIEIEKAVQLWNRLPPDEVKNGQKDPFNGNIGRKAAAAMNFLLLATAGRLWKQEFLEEPLSQMLNHATQEAGFTVNKKQIKDHIKRLIEGYAEIAKKGTGIVFVGTTKAVDWIDESKKCFCLNRELEKEPQIEQFKYFKSAIESDSQTTKDQLPPVVRTKTEHNGVNKKKSHSTDTEGRVHRFISDLQEIWADSTVTATTRQSLVEARLGQGQFRKEVLARWDNACAVTGSKTVAAIRASHIKPWRDCKDQERLDSENGLPLVASLDALFDRGLISFADAGNLLVADELSHDEKKLFGLHGARLSRELTARTCGFLLQHRLEHGFEA